MPEELVSLRPFIGAADFELSRSFYRDLGFEETILFHNMSVFTKDAFAFYLQDAYVKDWIDNTQIFLEVRDVDLFWKQLQQLSLDKKYTSVKLSTVKSFDWGKECYLHDPSGILWHIGHFNKK